MRHALLFLSCALLVACGSSKPHRLSQQEYVHRADAICARYNRFAKTVGIPAGVKQLVKAVDRSMPVFNGTVAELHALRPPEDEQALAHRWLVTLARLRSDVLDLRARAAANDLSGVQRVVRRARRDNGESNRLATRLGLHVCNSG